MPSKYTKKRPNKQIVDAATLAEAIKTVKVEKKSVLAAATTFNIPKSNLYRYIAKVDEEKLDVATLAVEQLLDFAGVCLGVGVKPIFTAAEEEALMMYVKTCSEIYYGLSRNELRTLAYEYAKKIATDYPAAWGENGMAGKDWYSGFMKRHPNLCPRTAEQISANRAKAFCKTNVDTFFANLLAVLDKNSYEPHRIFNMDETGFPTVPTRSGKIIAVRGAKRVSQKSSAERGTNVTMALAVNASGQSIPPFFLFPRKNMRALFLDNATPGSVGFANESGWMTSADFVAYMAHFVKHTGASQASPTLLLLDNHTSHLSVEAIDIAIEHGITMLSFPPHCSHKMQPLDVSVFGPVKTLYSTQCDAWMKSNVGRVLEIHHIPGIVDKCLDVAVTPKNIKSGFQATGIFPLNPHIFSEVDFVAAELSGENQIIDDIADGEGNQCNIIVRFDADDALAAHKEVTTSGSIASTSTATMSSQASICAALNEIGPLHSAPPAQKSNRGRKAMRSSILTAPEMVSDLKKKEEKRKANKRKREAKIGGKPSKEKEGKGRKAPAKKPRQALKKKEPTSSSSSSDIDFCIICMKDLPKKLNENNSINCNTCRRPVHLKCANITRSFFTCVNCESEYSDD